MNKEKKVTLVITVICILLVLIISLILTNKSNKQKNELNESQYTKETNIDILTLNNYNDYLTNIDNYSIFTQGYNFTENDFLENKYILLTYDTKKCISMALDKDYSYNENTLNIYYELEENCEGCINTKNTDIIKIAKDKEIQTTNVYYKLKTDNTCIKN